MHIIRLGVSALLAGSALAEPLAATLEELSFAEYQAHYGKSYSAKELEMRRGHFERSQKTVLKHNREYRAGVHTWYMALTTLADQSPEEFARLRSTKYSPTEMPLADPLPPAGPNPDSIDWRTKGAVTPVKNQGGCGSCWAFSATESVESHYFLSSGKLLTLAPQTYVDCVVNPQSCGGTGGCEGATMELAFNLTKTKGIATEADLPYRASDGACPQYKPAVVAGGYVKNPTNDAIALESALARVGPISVTVAASRWQLYGGGVFSGCSHGLFGTDATLDHGVQAVGYAQDYWLVRNSWGAGWGEQGYIRISRANDAKTFQDKHPADGVACKPLPKAQTVGGECGILFDTSYPTGVKAA